MLGMVEHIKIPILGEADLCEFKVCLIYRGSFRTTMDTQRNPAGGGGEFSEVGLARWHRG